MRQLTFNSYLLTYLAGISNVQTKSIHKLVKLMEKHYLMKDSLILYCALTNNQKLFNRYTNNQYSRLLESINKDNYLSDSFNDYEFKKIHSSYLSRVKAFEYDDETKRKARNTIMEIAKKKNITNYRIYKDLKLNPGNVNDFFKNDNPKKLSLNTVKSIYKYVMNY